MICLENIAGYFSSFSTKALPFKAGSSHQILLMLMQVDFYFKFLERSKLHVGNGICEQCALEQTRSLGQKDGMVGLHLQELPVQRGGPTMEPSQNSLLGFSYEGHPAGNGSCADIKLSMLLCTVVS